MVKRPLVSILTPAYKAEPYIGQAIESVLAQTMPDWELIIVEDCSPDNTAQVVEQYLGDPRIKLIRNEQNLGECGSRNRALDVAQGEWITLLDADDWYEPNRLERLLNLAEQQGDPIVVDVMRRISITGEELPATISPIYPVPQQPTLYDVYQYVYGHIAGQPMFRHDLIRRENLRYIPGVVKGGDYIFQTQLVYRAGHLRVLPEQLYNYRYHPNSMIQTLKGDWTKTQRLYQLLLELPEVRNDSKLRKMVLLDYRRELGAARIHEFRQALKRGRFDHAWRVYREAPGVLSVFLWERTQQFRRWLSHGTCAS